MGDLSQTGALFRMMTTSAERHNLENGAPAAAVPQSTNMVCPNCNTNDAILIANPGRGGIVCQKNGTHRWNDMGELRALNPRIIPAAPKIVPRATEGTVQLNILVHHTLKAQLEARFGTKLDVTLSALCGSLLDSEAYVVPGTEAAEISEVFGRTVKGCAALKGAVRELNRDRNDWRDKAQAVEQASSGTGTALAPGQVVVTLGPMLKDLKTKAEGQGLSLEEMLANVIYMGYQNQWF